MTANIFKLFSLGLVQGQWYGGSDGGGMTGTSCVYVLSNRSTRVFRDHLSAAELVSFLLLAGILGLPAFSSSWCELS